MTVQCIQTSLINPPQSIIKSGWRDASKYITLGKIYNVFAIDHRTDTDWYLICDDNFDDNAYNYPVYVPSIYFQINDNSKPQYWIRVAAFPSYEGPSCLSPNSYEDLIDGDPVAISYFRRLLYNGSDGRETR